MIGAALIASLLWGTADFLGGQASRKNPAAMVALVGQACGFVALALILLFHGVDELAIVPGLFIGVLSSVAVLCFYRALAVGTMSIVAPIVATSAIVPVLWGVFDGERPGALQWVGIVAALTGVMLASNEPGGKAENQRLALKLAFVAALGIGISLVFLDRAAEHDALTAVAAARIAAVPILLAVVLQQRARAPLARLADLRIRRPAGHRRQRHLRDRHDQRPAEPRRRARRALPRRHRRARLLHPADPTRAALRARMLQR